MSDTKWTPDRYWPHHISNHGSDPNQRWRWLVQRTVAPRVRHIGKKTFDTEAEAQAFADAVNRGDLPAPDYRFQHD